MAKYFVSYASGATGFGWEKEYDRIDEFEYLIKEIDRSTYFYVYDYEIKEIIYKKDCLDNKPTIDLLHKPLRDFRFKSRTYNNL